MQNRGDILAQEQTDSQYYVYLLSCAFLKDSSFHLEEDAQIEAAERHIIEQALRASQIIDALEKTREELFCSSPWFHAFFH